MVIFLAGAAGCLYFAGMLLWRWMLLYYMLPAVVFLAVAVSAIAFDRPATNLRRMAWPIVIVALLAWPMTRKTPERWRTAWTILAQDRSKDAILRALERQTRIAFEIRVAIFDVRSAEVGQSWNAILPWMATRGKHLSTTWWKGLG